MINKERLLKLAALLRTNASNPRGVKFDLSVWALHESDTNRRFPLNCNTTACAVGLACISGVFKDEGLEYVVRFTGIIPTYGEEDDWDAVQEFFGLNVDQADYLFVDSYYPRDERQEAKGEIAVADRIAAFVASNGSTNNMKYYDIDFEVEI